jgi:hypothetical protein
MTEIEVPPREERQIFRDLPRRSRKSRFVASLAALLFMLGIGWIAGAKREESALLAQRLWHRAGGMLSDLDAGRRHLTAGSETYSALSDSKGMDRSQPASGVEVVERVTGYLGRKLDQMSGSSETAIRSVVSATTRLGESVERNQRELLTKLEQVQERLNALERQAVVIANTRQAKLPEQHNNTPPAKTVPAIQPSLAVAGAKATPKPTPKEPKKVEHWTVREVADGVALVEGPSGLIEVSTGDVLPGVGRVEAISERGGQWVIATNKGVITSR